MLDANRHLPLSDFPSERSDSGPTSHWSSQAGAFAPALSGSAHDSDGSRHPSATARADPGRPACEPREESLEYVGGERGLHMYAGPGKVVLELNGEKVELEPAQALSLLYVSGCVIHDAEHYDQAEEAPAAARAAQWLPVGPAGGRNLNHRERRSKELHRSPPLEVAISGADDATGLARAFAARDAGRLVVVADRSDGRRWILPLVPAPCLAARVPASQRATCKQRPRERREGSRRRTRSRAGPDDDGESERPAARVAGAAGASSSRRPSRASKRSGGGSSPAHRSRIGLL